MREKAGEVSPVGDCRKEGASAAAQARSSVSRRAAGSSTAESLGQLVVPLACGMLIDHRRRGSRVSQAGLKFSESGSLLRGEDSAGVAQVVEAEVGLFAVALPLIALGPIGWAVLAVAAAGTLGAYAYSRRHDLADGWRVLSSRINVAARDAARVLPRAQRTSYRATKSYVVYQITGVHGGRRDTWKYGITSGTPGKRPALGLANCGARWTGCRVRILHWTMGYWAARRIERSYVFRYRYLHGHCPLGQISSCK